MALSHDKCLLASISLDDIVKIIDVSNLASRVKEDFDEDGYERDIKENPKIKRKKKTKKAAAEGEDADMAEERKEGDGSSSDDDDDAWASDSSDDDSDDSDDSEEKHTKKDKGLNVKGNTVQKAKKMIDDAKRK